MGKNIQKPEFIKFSSPENLKKIIKTEHNLYAIEGDTFHSFDRVSLAYDYIINTLNAKPIFNIYELKPELVGIDLREGWDKHTYIEAIPATKKNPAHTRMLFSYTNKDREEAIKQTYQDFLKLHQKWKNNQNDFTTAWQYVTNHPAFWHTLPNLPNYWDTENGWEGHYLTVYKNHKTGKPVVEIEHGPYMDTENLDETINPRMQHSHDHRLDTKAETFEEAVIKFAKKVNKYYTKTGKQRKQQKEL